MATTATSFHLQSTASLVASIQNFRINHTLLQYSTIVERSGVAFRLFSGVGMELCASDPCSNGGQCIDLWTRYGCSCPLGFTGERCEIYNMAHFPGDAFLNMHVAAVTNISFEFSTLQQSGIVMTTISVSALSDT